MNIRRLRHHLIQTGPTTQVLTMSDSQDNVNKRQHESDDAEQQAKTVKRAR